MYSRLIIDSPLVYQDQLNDGKHKNSQHRRFIYIETLSIPMTIITVGGAIKGNTYLYNYFWFDFKYFLLIYTIKNGSKAAAGFILVSLHGATLPSISLCRYLHVPFVKLQTGTAKNICKTW